MEKSLMLLNKIQEEKLLKEIKEDKNTQHLAYKVECVCDNYKLIIKNLLDKQTKGNQE